LLKVALNSMNQTSTNRNHTMNNLARFAFNRFRIIIFKNVVSYEIYKGKKIVWILCPLSEHIPMMMDGKYCSICYAGSCNF
jgi:hypothetical protein